MLEMIFDNSYHPLIKTEKHNLLKSPINSPLKTFHDFNTLAEIISFQELISKPETERIQEISTRLVIQLEHVADNR